MTESRVHGSLLADVAERADAYVAYLGVSDRAQLKERVQTAKENLQRSVAAAGSAGAKHVLLGESSVSLAASKNQIIPP